jgi:transposase
MEIEGAWGSTQILLDDTSNWSMQQNELGIAFETLKVFKSETLPLPIRHFWDCLEDETALMTFRGWYGWATRSQLKPIIKVAKMLKRHLNGLMNYIEHRITNAVSEGFNSRIQSIKSAARGFRNFDNYRIRILFFCAKLDLSLKTFSH